MNTDLIPIMQNLPVSQYATNDVFNDIAKSTTWLPRLQLFGSNSEECKTGKVPIAHYGLVKDKDTLIDLGESVNVLPIRWRPKAMRFPQGQNPVSFYDPNDEGFKKIKEDSSQPNARCIFGPEFLIYVLDKNEFATFLMGNKTARNVAQEVLGYMQKGRAITLKAKLIRTPSYSWHGPQIFPCSLPVTLDPLLLEAEVEKFNNPPKNQVEEVTEETPTDDRVT